MPINILREERDLPLAMSFMVTNDIYVFNDPSVALGSVPPIIQAKFMM
jgi:hypothetical protein